MTPAQCLDRPVAAKNCPLCGAVFTCGPQSSNQHCWCEELPKVGVVGDAGQDCLCPNCLAAAMSANNTTPISVPEVSDGAATQPELNEGEDFYWEGTAMVFTSQYLLRRGYCCESGCRHCPYTNPPKMGEIAKAA
jgi:hypothetical protein